MKTRDEQIAKLEQMQPNTPSKWREEAEFRSTNREWLRESQKIATTMLIKMEELGLKQWDLAEKMGVSQQYVSRILRGKENLTLNTIIKIEEALHITILSLSKAI
ncbi:helix-turn-helix transcriptional regulator [Bacteroides sp. 224]|uniref:helix-turn-helix transcriptional regulator n=1 Tax=Bacteroides sp. 224 TaxID=2302936 RepID=UPI0013D7D656|nr:helix-turn-helix transcriptional regulator [Bacteroides sp. 224]NDV65899.1 XRE family transcriptional regulator [Bacteroides sp. 224]